MNASLHRIVGIPAKVVYGTLVDLGPHNWNEVLIAGQWLNQDPTIDAGEIEISDGRARFVRISKFENFFASKKEFERTHQIAPGYRGTF